MLHKQHGKEYLRDCYYNPYYSESTSFWISPLVNSKEGVYFAMLFTLRLLQRWGNKDLIPVFCVDSGRRMAFV